MKKKEMIAIDPSLSATAALPAEVTA